MTGTPRPQRTQEQVTVACDRVVKARGGGVVVIGRNSVNQTPGLPPRRYIVDRVALWFYPRTERGRLSVDALKFLLQEIDAGQLLGAGDEDDLAALLQLARLDLDRARSLGALMVDRVVERGLWPS